MIITVLILSYLLGSIPSALIIGKGFYGIDIRKHGSGNLGATNTFRTLGAKAGFIVTFMDILKGTLAAALPALLAVNIHPLIAGAFAVIGHVYPIFAKFRGGKAVATSAGIILYFAPYLFLSLLVLFAIVLFTTRYVSLSSIVIAVAGAISSFFIKGGDTLFTIMTVGIALFIIIRHRANIRRILNGTEPKVNFKRKKTS
ncbi:MAG: glycerol-3-phosphate 1-O-acyltransferase PlsY [Bacillaceae bacterium]